MSLDFLGAINMAQLTVDPGVTNDGDIWYRSDLGQIKTKLDGKTTNLYVGGEASLARFTAGRWYPIPGYGNYTAAVTNNNRAYAVPFWPGKKCTLNGVAYEVTTLGAGNARVGVYEDDGNASPGALVGVDFGTVSIASTGVKTWAPSVALDPVLYWLVFASQTTTAPQMRLTQGVHPLIGEIGASPTMGTTNRMAYYTDTGFSGAFPASFGVPAGALIAPLAKVKFA